MINSKYKTAILLMSILATGCKQSPFDDTTYTPSSELIERLHSIDRIELEQHRKSKTQKEDQLAKEKLEPAPKKLELSIEQAMTYALNNNLDLIAQKYAPTQSQLQIEQARAVFEPKFSSTSSFSSTDAATASTLNGSQTKNASTNLSFDFPLETGGNVNFNLPLNRFKTDNSFSTLNPSYNSDLSFSISHPLMRGAGKQASQNQIRVAQIGKTLVDAQTKFQTLTTIANTQRQYWNLYAAKKTLAVREQEIKYAQAQLTRAKNLVKAGTTPKVEILRAEAGLSQKIESLIISKNNVQNHQRQLKQILNIPNVPIHSKTHLEVTGKPNPIAYELNAQSLLKLAQQHRTQLLEIELQLLQDASAIDLARNQLLPLLNLQYTYNANGLGGSLDAALNQASQRSFEDHRISLTAQVPLGNRSAKSQLKSALLTRMQRLTTKKSRQQLIELEVLNAIDHLQSTWQRILASQNNTLLSARLLKSEERQFGQGQNTSTDVLNAQTSLANAQLAEINALKDYQIAMIDLAVATGTIEHTAKIKWNSDVQNQLDQLNQ